MGEYSKGKATRSVRLQYVNWRFKKRQQDFLAPLPGNKRFCSCFCFDCLDGPSHSTCGGRRKITKGLCKPAIGGLQHAKIRFGVALKSSRWRRQTPLEEMRQTTHIDISSGSQCYATRYNKTEFR